MRKHQIENAAFEVATQVRTVEETIDQALAEIAELQSKLVHVRVVTGAGVATGHAAFEQLACAQRAGRRARRNGQLPRRAGRGQAIRARAAHGRVRRYRMPAADRRWRPPGRRLIN